MHRLIRLVERRPLVAVGALVVVVLLVGIVPRVVSLGDDGHAPDEGSLEIIPASIAFAQVEEDAGLARRCGGADEDSVRVELFSPPLATIHVGDCTLRLREQSFGDWRVTAILDR